MPPWLGDVLAQATADFAKYPSIRGTPDLLAALGEWHRQRYGLTLAPDAEICVLNGSREGLASAIQVALIEARDTGRDGIAMPNPFYQCYAAAAIAGGGRPEYMSVGAATGHLPDLEALATSPERLARLAALVLCSPSNPQGAVADAEYLLRAIALAREAGFMLFVDECYSEIHGASVPPGALEIALTRTGSNDRVSAFNSLSKRSNVPGLRSGFAAGDAAFMARMVRLRNVMAPQVPMPIQHASAALWRDEDHVAASRKLYEAKFDLADAILGDRYGYRRPGGGFFLWLDMERHGGGERAAVTLWKDYGVKVLPGGFLSQVDATGHNPGARYIRCALVHNLEITDEALHRISAMSL